MLSHYQAALIIVRPPTYPKLLIEIAQFSELKVKITSKLVKIVQSIVDKDYMQ